MDLVQHDVGMPRDVARRPVLRSRLPGIGRTDRSGRSGVVK
jgi:hypothetical protein